MKLAFLLVLQVWISDTTRVEVALKQALSDDKLTTFIESHKPFGLTTDFDLIATKIKRYKFAGEDRLIGESDLSWVDYVFEFIEPGKTSVSLLIKSTQGSGRFGSLDYYQMSTRVDSLKFVWTYGMHTHPIQWKKEIFFISPLHDGAELLYWKNGFLHSSGKWQGVFKHRIDLVPGNSMVRQLGFLSDAIVDSLIEYDIAEPHQGIDQLEESPSFSKVNFVNDFKGWGKVTVSMQDIYFAKEFFLTSVGYMPSHVKTYIFNHSGDRIFETELGSVENRFFDFDIRVRKHDKRVYLCRYVIPRSRKETLYAILYEIKSSQEIVIVEKQAVPLDSEYRWVQNN